MIQLTLCHIYLSSTARLIWYNCVKSKLLATYRCFCVIFQVTKVADEEVMKADGYIYLYQ